MDRQPDGVPSAVRPPEEYCAEEVRDEAVRLAGHATVVGPVAATCDHVAPPPPPLAVNSRNQLTHTWVVDPA